MILAHHMGEDLVAYAVASGGGAAPVLLAVWRARIARLVGRRRRK